MIKRIQRKRTAGWRMPENCMCATRPTIFGNPWKGPDAVVAYERFIQQVMEGAICVSVIELGLDVAHVFKRPIDQWRTLRDAMFQFRVDYRLGKMHDLCCYCSPKNPCHVDVLIRCIKQPTLDN